LNVAFFVFIYLCARQETFFLRSLRASEAMIGELCIGK